MTRTVVIVDDYQGFRTAARTLLEAGDYHVVGEAADGASALVAVRQHRPQVVLLDVLLPDMNGFEVAELLADATAESKIVMISSRDKSLFQEPLSRSRAAGFIYKGDLSPRELDLLLGHDQ